MTGSIVLPGVNSGTIVLPENHVSVYCIMDLYDGPAREILRFSLRRTLLITLWDQQQNFQAVLIRIMTCAIF